MSAPALKLVPTSDTAPVTRQKKALVADLFCGAGGSSTGAMRALDRLGYRMDLVAVNHWNVAIDTHSRNHPQARHYCQDIATLRPTVAVPEGRLDLLMASPTCTYHSRARGGKPTSDQQRMDPWHVVTWLTELRVKRLLIENVPEFLEWGPVDVRTGKPIKSRRGEYFQSWVRALEGVGMRCEWRVLNAADYGDATTRQRFFLMGRSDGKPIRWPLPTHSRTGGGLPGIAETKRWRAAREIIDWEIKGKSIFDRKKPLSPKTLARIYAGAVKFKWPEPFLVILRQHMDAQSVDGPIPTVTASGTHIGLAQPLIRYSDTEVDAHGDPRLEVIPNPFAEPVILNRHGDNGGGVRATSIAEPVPTVTTSGAGYVVEPFVLSQASGGAPRETTQPLPTVTTDGAHALIAPYYGSGSGTTCSSAEQPLPACTTKARFAAVVPITHSQGGNGGARSAEEPLPTILCSHGSELALAMPVTHGGTGNRARSVDDPLPTITGAHRGEHAVIVAQHGERPGQAPRVHSVEEPTPTICAGGRVQLAEARDYDILFRMLEPHELAAAMGFSNDEQQYEFAGTKTDAIRQIGNAVPVHLAEALISACFSEGR